MSKLRSKELEDAVGDALLALLGEDVDASDPLTALRLKVVEAYLKAAKLTEPDEKPITAHTGRVSRTLERMKEK